MTRTALATSLPMGVPSPSEIIALGLANIFYLLMVGLVVWAFKKGWIGIVTFGPYDRGYREFFGRPGRLLRTGPHPHVIGLGNLRRASVAESIIEISRRVRVDDVIFSYYLTIVVQIVDEANHVWSAIYNTFDEKKTDAYNAQRLAYVERRIEGSIRSLLEDGQDIDDITVELLLGECGDQILLKSGTAVRQMIVNEFTVADAQLIASAINSIDISAHLAKVVDISTAASA